MNGNNGYPVNKLFLAINRDKNSNPKMVIGSNLGANNLKLLINKIIGRINNATDVTLINRANNTKSVIKLNFSIVVFLKFSIK